MEGIDLVYLNNLIGWIQKERSDLKGCKTYWIDDMSLKEGATKFITHLKVYIDLEGGKGAELNESYTMIRLYPLKDFWYRKIA